MLFFFSPSNKEHVFVKERDLRVHFPSCAFCRSYIPEVRIMSIPNLRYMKVSVRAASGMLSCSSERTDVYPGNSWQIQFRIENRTSKISPLLSFFFLQRFFPQASESSAENKWNLFLLLLFTQTFHIFHMKLLNPTRGGGGGQKITNSSFQRCPLWKPSGSWLNICAPSPPLFWCVSGEPSAADPD